MYCFRSRQVVVCYEYVYNRADRHNFQNLPGVASETDCRQRRAMQANQDFWGKNETQKSEDSGCFRMVSPLKAVAAMNRTSIARATGASGGGASPGNCMQWNN